MRTTSSLMVSICRLQTPDCRLDCSPLESGPVHRLSPLMTCHASADSFARDSDSDSDSGRSGDNDQSLERDWRRAYAGRVQVGVDPARS